MPRNVRMEWRQGSTGLGSVYVFNPKPDITRADPALKQAEIDIPLADGVTIQDLGRGKRVIRLHGPLVAKSKLFEDLEDLRDALINGIGESVGQLHIISVTNTGNPKHIYYIGQIQPSGFQFEEQTNPIYLYYTIEITCADPTEYHADIAKTINSDADIKNTTIHTINSAAKVV